MMVMLQLASLSKSTATYCRPWMVMTDAIKRRAMSGTRGDGDSNSAKSNVFLHALDDGFTVHALPGGDANGGVVLGAGDPTAPAATPRQARPSARPLAVFLPWLGARPQAAQRYRDLYHALGMDVFTVESHVSHFLWPRSGIVRARRALELLATEPRLTGGDGSPEGGRPLYVHAMSVGAYMFSLMLLVAQGEPGRYGTIIGRVRAQVFDSMVAGSLEHMAKGVSVTSMPSYLSGLTYRSTLAYFSLLRPYTVAYYEEALAAFKRGPCYAPALVYYSLDDRLSDAAVVNDTVEGWRGRGQEVSSVCWDKSRHAAHMRTHESEYLEALHSFMAARGVRRLAPAKL
ncbi:uncharacterized protein LOC133351407 isoform X2 [Lethenteron reissneri]|uniref:uncharacterized protein LOC133351407 isoform X2 n=1 Tax=Lethenteron reissneri TaxID=7753 RepID=UPI002AB7C7D2|nr:uncharacterized protein LOC133351407 isoform X2 [Lethenteron reissneri]